MKRYRLEWDCWEDPKGRAILWQDFEDFLQKLEKANTKIHNKFEIKRLIEEARGCK